MMDVYTRSVGVTAGALLASAGTLVCCALPAVMVSLGAGATLVALISTFPQLVWLSEHKPFVFGVATALLMASGIVMWRVRSLPCPADPELRRRCGRLRRMGNVFGSVALLSLITGAAFAFLLPALG